MIDLPIRKAGNALIWQSVKMGGVKVIYLVRTLILARLLLPDDFGLIAIAITATGFLFNITNLGMAPALVQGENMDDTHYDSAWTLDLMRSFLLFIITVAAAPLIAQIFAEPRAVPIIQVLAIRPFIEAMTSIKVVALNRNLTFRPLAVLRIIEAVVNTVLAIIFAKEWGAWALVVGAIGGTISIVVVSYLLAPYRPRLIITRETIKPLINFGRWIFAANLVALLGNSILRVLISRQYGAAGLGIYFMASQLAFLPGDVAGEAVGAVAFPLFARLQNEVSQAIRVFRAIFSGLAAVLYPVCASIVVLAPSLTKEILGPNWVGTEDIIRILALVVMFGIFGDVAVSVFKGLGQPYIIVVLEITQSTVTISLVWLLTQRFGLVGAALAWLPAIILSQGLCVYYLKKILDHPFQGLHKPFFAIFLATCLCVAIAAGINSLIPGIVGFSSAVILGLLCTGLSLWMADRRYHLGFVHNLASAFPQVATFVGFPPIEKR